MSTDHKLTIDGWEGSLEDLGRALENLRYDALVVVLRGLRDALDERSEADTLAGKQQLGKALYQASYDASMLVESMEDVWGICMRKMALDPPSLV